MLSGFAATSLSDSPSVGSSSLNCVHFFCNSICLASIDLDFEDFYDPKANKGKTAFLSDLTGDSPFLSLSESKGLLSLVGNFKNL